MATGFFGGSMSPVEGVRLLDPGERLVAERHEDGWRIESQARIGVDAIVLAGRAGANRLDDALDEAAQALIGTATGLSQIYSGPIELGLSGGKDSRLIAAASLAAGLRPNLVTNIDVPEEGETASELVAIVRKTRGIDLNHRLRKVSDPATVLDVGLAERIDRFQHLFDYQYPSSFSVRPPPGPRLEMDVDVRLSGVGGELVSGYWYPKAKQTPVDTATRQLMRAIPQAALRSDVHAAEEARIRGILAAISEAGLDAEHIIDYLYLVERVRRWYSSAYSFMIITPFLAPGFVKASFAFDPREKRERAVHARLLQRLLPEWADIPFVSDTSTTTATRVWQGDGITTIAEMRDTCKGQLPAMVEPDEVDKALRRAHEGKLADSQVLRQFAWAAQASKRLEPGTVEESTGVTYGRITSPEPLVPLRPKPPAVPKPLGKSGRSRQPLVALARKVAYATPWGKRAWSAAGALLAGRK
jgi:asparagine synthase (glutamine-hydrolysing)